LARRNSIKDDLLNMPFGKPKVEEKICDMDSCDRLGDHKAPKSKQNLREYYWFCMEHIQVYNKSWNFYEGMTPGEIESHRKADTTWQRPTWGVGKDKTFATAGFADPMGMFEGEADIQKIEKDRLIRSLTGVQKRGLDLLNLEVPVSAEEVKKAYKALVKKFHPDINQDDPEAEERLKEINQAFASLKKGIQ
jgi:hypothetical protein